MRRLLPLLWCGAALGFAADLQLEPAGRPLRLEVQKLGLYAGKKHQFEFPAYRGTIHFDAAAPEKSRVDLEVDAGDFRLLDTWVSEKDRKSIIEYTRSKDMLETGKFPKITFRSESAAAAGDAGYRVTGQLSIHGVAKPVTLEITSRNEGSGLRLEGRTVFPMSQFGLKPPSAALGLIRTKDEMSLEFEVIAK